MSPDISNVLQDLHQFDGPSLAGQCYSEVTYRYNKNAQQSSKSRISPKALAPQESYLSIVNTALLIPKGVGSKAKLIVWPPCKALKSLTAFVEQRENTELRASIDGSKFSNPLFLIADYSDLLLRHCFDSGNEYPQLIASNIFFSNGDIKPQHFIVVVLEGAGVEGSRDFGRNKELKVFDANVEVGHERVSLEFGEVYRRNEELECLCALQLSLHKEFIKQSLALEALQVGRINENFLERNFRDESIHTQCANGQYQSQLYLLHYILYQIINTTTHQIKNKTPFFPFFIPAYTPSAQKKIEVLLMKEHNQMVGLIVCRHEQVVRKQDGFGSTDKGTH